MSVPVVRRTGVEPAYVLLNVSKLLSVNLSARIFMWGCIAALPPPYIVGATGEGRTLTGISQRSLNPLRLPISPQSHLVPMRGLEPRRSVERTFLRRSRLPIPAHRHMELQTRIELALSDWKSDALPLNYWSISGGSLQPRRRFSSYFGLPYAREEE